MQINISNISKTSSDKEQELRRIKIKIKHSEYWILGEQNKNRTWNIFLVNKSETYKKLLEENYLTRDFSLFTTLILKEPFNYEG